MRVLFFAQLKDVTGCDSVELAPPAPLNAEQLWSELIEEFPELADHRENVRLAAQLGIRRRRTPFLRATDEIALIPPVSGG